MANKDYFDRIADALEIISGDDSHIDEVDKNMDYYKRIAEALENISKNNSNNNGNCFVISFDHYDESTGKIYYSATPNQIINNLQTKKIVMLLDDSNQSEISQFFLNSISIEEGGEAGMIMFSTFRGYTGEEPSTIQPMWIRFLFADPNELLSRGD